jgi:hypothetical protein
MSRRFQCKSVATDLPTTVKLIHRTPHHRPHPSRQSPLPSLPTPAALGPMARASRQRSRALAQGLASTDLYIIATVGF